MVAVVTAEEWEVEEEDMISCHQLVQSLFILPYHGSNSLHYFLSIHHLINFCSYFWCYKQIHFKSRHQNQFKYNNHNSSKFSNNNNNNNSNNNNNNVSFNCKFSLVINQQYQLRISVVLISSFSFFLNFTSIKISLDFSIQLSKK